MAVPNARKEKVVGNLNTDDAGELDPLLTFLVEPGAVDAAETPEKPADPAAAAAVAVDEELSRRLGNAERQLERTRSEISALRTDLATLVSAVGDIRTRLSRPPERPALVVPVLPIPRRQLPPARTIATIVVLVALGAATWSLLSATTDEPPGPPLLESESSTIIALPTVVAARSPYALADARDSGLAGLASVASRSAVTVPSPPPHVVNYVGSLTIDAEPAGDVFVNRQSMGRTPLRLDKLRAGSHLIWIEREGYRRWTRVVAVAADRISRVSASLDPIPR